MIRSSVVAATLAFASLASSVNAQEPVEVATDPVGFVKVEVPAQSEASIAIPFHRPAVFKGKIGTIDGNTIGIEGQNTWVTSQFLQNGSTQPETFAIVIASGSKEGMIAKIIANTENSLSVEFQNGDSFEGVIGDSINGDYFNIIPYWTPKSLFITPPAIGSQLFGYSTVTVGINHPPTQIFAFDGENWIDDILGEIVDNQPLQIGAGYTFRNFDNQPYKISYLGAVPMVAHRSKIATFAANMEQDIRVGYTSPIPETLSMLNIPANSGDVIFGYDNSATGINKAPVFIYAFDGQKWVDDLLGQPIGDTVELQPGIGYLYRKLGTVQPQQAVWSHSPSYLE